jgi:hypothetical protein
MHVPLGLTVENGGLPTRPGGGPARVSRRSDTVPRHGIMIPQRGAAFPAAGRPARRPPARGQAGQVPRAQTPGPCEVPRARTQHETPQRRGILPVAQRRGVPRRHLHRTQATLAAAGAPAKLAHCVQLGSRGSGGVPPVRFPDRGSHPPPARAEKQDTNAHRAEYNGTKSTPLLPPPALTAWSRTATSASVPNRHIAATSPPNRKGGWDLEGSSASTLVPCPS